MSLEVVPTRLDGPKLLAPKAFGDERGFFVETFRASALEELGIDETWVQDNHSRSSRGVVRGLHFQLDPPAAKLVRCGRGAIVDVLVDVRAGSATFGEWEAFALDDQTLRVLYVPAGFAHGFCVVSDVADVIYKQSAYWNPEADLALAFDDPDVGVDWPLPAQERVVSERDRTAPSLRELRERLVDAPV